MCEYILDIYTYKKIFTKNNSRFVSGLNKELTEKIENEREREKRKPNEVFAFF